MDRFPLYCARLGANSGRVAQQRREAIGIAHKAGSLACQAATPGQRVSGYTAGRWGRHQPRPGGMEKEGFR